MARLEDWHYVPAKEIESVSAVTAWTAPTPSLVRYWVLVHVQPDVDDGQQP